VISKEDQEIFYKKLGESIRAARKRSNFTQDDLADHLGLTRVSIVNFEQGTQKIQLHNLLELTSLLNIQAGDLLTPLYAIVKVDQPGKAERSIPNEVKQLTDREEGTEILKDFIKYSKYKK
jgi:transcriptional regulator with XRE-family HTH domain